MKILCPIDYSKNAMSALETSIYYTKLLEADLHIINVVKTPIEVNKCTVELNQILDGISAVSQGHIKPTISVVHGYTAQEILQYSNRNEIDWIIMGTKGHNSLKNVIFGSVTKDVASISQVPVLVVPQELASEFNTNMLLAIDSHKLKNKEIFAIPIEIAKSNDVKIDVLHIQLQKNIIPFDPILFLFLKDRVGEVHLIKGKDISRDIKNYVEKENIGLLIMIRRHRNLLDRLLKASNTAEEAAITNTHLLILPELQK